MNLKRKVFHCTVQCLIYLLAFVLFSHFWGHLYIFDWLQHNKFIYLAISVITLLLTAFKSERLGYVLTIGNLVSLLIGHFLGEFMRKMSMSRITSGMDAQMEYQMSQNYGVFIWLLCLILLVSFYGLFRHILSKRRNI